MGDQVHTRSNVLMLMTNQEKQSLSRHHRLIFFERDYWWTEGIVGTLLARNWSLIVEEAVGDFCCSWIYSYSKHLPWIRTVTFLRNKTMWKMRCLQFCIWSLEIVEEKCQNIRNGALTISLKQNSKKDISEHMDKESHPQFFCFSPISETCTNPIIFFCFFFV